VPDTDKGGGMSLLVFRKPDRWAKA
jgi:hypothetical protein